MWDDGNLTGAAVLGKPAPDPSKDTFWPCNKTVTEWLKATYEMSNA